MLGPKAPAAAALLGAFEGRKGHPPYAGVSYSTSPFLIA